MTHLNHDDPRFTAKALGEDENQIIDPADQKEFTSLESFAEDLKSELKARDEEEVLTREQKERIRATVGPKPNKVWTFPVLIQAVAACLMLGLVGIISFQVLDRSATLPTEEHAVEPVKPDFDTLEAGRESNQPRQRLAGLSETQKPVASNSADEKSLQPPAAPPPEPASALIRRDAPKPDAEPAVVSKEFSTAAADGMDSFQQMATPAEGKAGGMLATFVREGEEARAYHYSSPPEPLPGKPLKQESWNREAYDRIEENTFRNPIDHPLSTFSIDVDTASYANLRRFLNNGQLPPPDAIRIEELVNYFPYDYAGPTDNTPFAVHVDSASAPWNNQHRLVRIALQGKQVDTSERPDANLVFLIDVSGSMSAANKLPLVQRALNLLVDQMEARDRIAVVVYAGASGLALPSTTANNKETIQHAISNLKSGGSTNGGAGIELAYSMAQKHFIEDGINRVILCTDGDFNVGTTDRGSLTRLIEEKAKTGVFFSVLGFGMGNYQDASMEELSNTGNGNYSYIDSFQEARKVFVDDMLGTLFAIAKDVKIQVEFNPAQVTSYRLIGYENRILAKEDFNDDRKDAGEIGAGHRVTAFYEIVPPGIAPPQQPGVDSLKYQTASTTADDPGSLEMLTVKLRYKRPDESVSQLLEEPFTDSDRGLKAASGDFRFAASVAAFGMILRQSEYHGDMTLDDVHRLAELAKGQDTRGLRSEFIQLVEKAKGIQLDEKKSSPAGNPRN